MEEKMGEKVEKIGKIERLDPKAQIADVTDAQDIAELESRSKFDAAITKAERNWDHSQAASITQVNSTQETAVTRPSLIEDISFSEKKIQRLQPASIDQITAQAEDLRSAMQEPITKLTAAVENSPQGKISPIYEAQLGQRLVHIDSSLRTAVGKVGVEVTDQTVKPLTPNHMVTSLNYLTTSDHQLSTLISEVKALDISKNRLTPEKLLAVQIKLGFVQQELEFFTNILNKALESIKTTMNVQI